MERDTGDHFFLFLHASNEPAFPLHSIVYLGTFNEWFHMSYGINFLGEIVIALNMKLLCNVTSYSLREYIRVRFFNMVLWNIPTAYWTMSSVLEI